MTEEKPPKEPGESSTVLSESAQQPVFDEFDDPEGSAIQRAGGIISDSTLAQASEEQPESPAESGSLPPVVFEVVEDAESANAADEEAEVVYVDETGELIAAESEIEETDPEKEAGEESSYYPSLVDEPTEATEAEIGDGESAELLSLDDPADESETEKSESEAESTSDSTAESAESKATEAETSDDWDADRFQFDAPEDKEELEEIDLGGWSPEGADADGDAADEDVGDAASPARAAREARATRRNDSSATTLIIAAVLGMAVVVGGFFAWKLISGSKEKDKASKVKTEKKQDRGTIPFREGEKVKF